MAAEMRGPTTGGGRPGVGRRVSSVFDMGSSSRAPPSIASPPRRSSARPGLSSSASFSVGSGGGPTTGRLFSFLVIIFLFLHGNAHACV